MARTSIPVDLLNPGQVFACLGLLEAADVLVGGAQGGFEWSDQSSPRFAISAGGGENPVGVVLRFLATARVTAVAPPGSLNTTEKWGVATEVAAPDDPFPFPDPASPATLPGVIEGPLPDGGKARLVLDHWGDTTARDNVKFWAGAQGKPGAAFLSDAVELVRGQLELETATANPFAVAAPQSGSLRFDWRRDYIPIDLGFSLNNHKGRIAAVGYPLVEVFAALGLSHARPLRVHKLEYRYSVIGSVAGREPAPDRPTTYDPILIRAALGACRMPFPQRTFRMKLGWPGQENQARCITEVTEEEETGP